MKLWHKGKNIDKEIEFFSVGDDYLLDLNLVKYDCTASIVHAKMLNKIGILTNDELKNLIEGLNEIIKLHEKNEFNISCEDEDCHTAIENYMVKKYGDTGKKIHTGRSRNDQVITALKIFMIEELKKIKSLAESLIIALKEFSKNNEKIPGYTHTRKAMPSSVKMWTEGFIDALNSDLIMIDFALKFLDSNPLGSAAGYGVNLLLDREFTSKELGFSRIEEITAVQINRGKNEAIAVQALLYVMLDLGKMSTDLIMFSMPEFGYFNLPEKFCTGSSIMPQKKNPDVLELIRAKSKILHGKLNEILNVIQGMPSGYHRDFQLTKKPMMESFEITKSSLSIMAKIINEIKVNNDNCKKAMTPELFAANEANELVKKGMSFRDAYKKVGEKF